MTSTSGFVYVATGARYREEAAASSASLRLHHPDALVCLVSDRADGPVFWDDFVNLTEPAFGFRDKIAMRLCPYERFIYLDSDTYVLGDLSELFGLLDRFDFAGHQLFEGHDYHPPGVPDVFPDFNSGVLAFRRSPAVERFFARWVELYALFFARNQPGDYHYANVGDQQSLRVAAYESELRIAVLGPEYNFVPAHVNFACGPVRVLHARGIAQLESLGRRINRQLGNRVYVPVLDTIISAETLGSELRRLWWMVTLQLARRAGRMLTPLALRNWLRRHPLVRRLFLRNAFGESANPEDPKWHRSTMPPPPV